MRPFENLQAMTGMNGYRNFVDIRHPGAGQSSTRRPAARGCPALRVSRLRILQDNWRVYYPCSGAWNTRTESRKHPRRRFARLPDENGQVRIILLDRLVLRQDELPGKGGKKDIYAITEQHYENAHSPSPCRRWSALRAENANLAQRWRKRPRERHQKRRVGTD
jgi:hypothetical protein